MLTELLLKGPAEQCCSFSFQLHTHTPARARAGCYVMAPAAGGAGLQSLRPLVNAAKLVGARSIFLFLIGCPPRALLRGPVLGGGALIFHPERPYFCGWNSRQLGCSSVSLVCGHAPAGSAGLMFTVANANALLRLLPLAPETFT